MTFLRNVDINMNIFVFGWYGLVVQDFGWLPEGCKLKSHKNRFINYYQCAVKGIFLPKITLSESVTKSGYFGLSIVKLCLINVLTKDYMFFSNIDLNINILA